MGMSKQESNVTSIEVDELTKLLESRSDDVIRALQAKGYSVKVVTKRHTFEVEEPLLAEFNRLIKTLNLMSKDAINEAIRMFIKTKASLVSTSPVVVQSQQHESSNQDVTETKVDSTSVIQMKVDTNIK